MMKLFSQPEILERYLEAHSSKEDPILAELSRHTYLKEAYPQMLSGHIQGAFLTLFSSLIAPSRILEIGTYTGYSAICLARGLKEGGKLITVEVNDELSSTARRFFKKAGLEDRIDLLNGDAQQLIPQLDGSFDLVFIDANKEHYPEYYRLVRDKVHSGGYIMADNVLWGGKVLDDHAKDAATESVRQFNKLVAEDQGVENLLLPLRDGIMLIKKY